MSSTPFNSESKDFNTQASKSSESPPAKQRKLINANIWNRYCFESKMREIKFEHLWIINNLSYHCMKSPYDQNYVLNSSVFSSPKDDQLKMSLKLSFHDCDKHTKNKYRVSLRINNCERIELTLKYTIRILNSDSDFIPYSISSIQKISKNNGNNFDCSKFLSSENEHNQNSSFDMPGDVLTIQCEICYEFAVDDDNSADNNKIALAHLQNVCVQLLENAKESYDVELVFGKRNKTKLPAHKAILGARSEVFAAMFDHDMREKSNNRVEMKDVDAEVGKVFLDYLYGKMPYLHEISDELLSIADKYQLHSLKSICEGALCFRINPNTVASLLFLADIHNAALLKSKCIDYIHCYANNVVENTEAKALMESKLELCYELFQYIPKSTLFSWLPPTLTDYPNLSSWSYTGSRVLKCSHRWTIDNFRANYLTNEGGENHFIESTLFPSDKSNSNSSVQFRLFLNPQGMDDDNKGNLSLFCISKFSKNIKVAIKIRFSIVVIENSEKGDIEKEYKAKSSSFIVSKDCKRGWANIINNQELMDNSELILKNDRLVIFCEVSYIENIDKLEIKAGLNTFAQENEFSATRDISKLYQSQKLTDAIFVLGSKEFKVHKPIVSVRSKVFAQMFSNSNRVQIEDFDDVDTFERMLALVYGQTEGLTQWALKMLPLLDKFQLDSLKHVCQLALCDQLEEKNVVEYLIIAEKYSANLLKSKAIELIRSKHSVFMQNDALRVVQQDNPELFCEVLCYKLVNLERID